MDALKHAVPNRQHNPGDEPEWAANDVADQNAFQAIIEARDSFFGVIRDRLTCNMLDRYGIDPIEVAIDSVNCSLEEAGLPLDEHEITEAIDLAIEEDAQDAVDNYDER